MDVQGDTLSGKPVLRKKDFLAPFLKICIGEWDVAGLRIGNQLDGTVFGIPSSGERRESLPVFADPTGTGNTTHRRNFA